MCSWIRWARRLNSGVFLCQVVKGSMVLAGFVCLLDRDWSYHRERSFSWEVPPGDPSVGHFLTIGIKRGGLLVGGTISGLVFLGSIKSRLAGWWWCMPLLPAFGRQRQADF